MKQHFFLKLIPPRPTFALDMNDAERALMLQHVAYFQKQFEAGKVLVYGPVLAPEGFGMGVFEVESPEEVQAIMADDPTIKAGLNTFAIYQMRLGGAQASR
jgi:uncharacterized protein YciI